MNDRNIRIFKDLVREAKHSYMVAAASAGNDPRVNLVLAKWPDVTDSLLEFIEHTDTAYYIPGERDKATDKVIGDLAHIICAPLAKIAAGLSMQLEEDQAIPYMEKINKLLSVDTWPENPIKIKNGFISVINEMIDVGKLEYRKIEPIDKQEV
jgi:hypothetical protein